MRKHFPSFGSERMGAPVISFCRIDDKPIRSREPVYKPNAIIIQDPTLLHGTTLFEGLAQDGYILLNSVHDFHTLRLDELIRTLPSRRFWCKVGTFRCTGVMAWNEGS